MSYDTTIIVFEDLQEATQSANQFLSANFKVRVIGPTKEVELAKGSSGPSLAAEAPGPHYVVIATRDEIGPVYQAADQIRHAWR